MRSLVISALSRPRETSRRSVFMLTGMTACTIGSTRAPPFSTTFWPPNPVRTNARSLEERRYSQFSSHTMIATTIATTIRPNRKLPNWAPVMIGSSFVRVSCPAHGLEAPGRLGQCGLHRQPFHAGGAVEAVALGAASQHVGGVVRSGDRAAVTQHDDTLVHLAGRPGPAPDAGQAFVERQGGVRADAAARGEPQMAHDHVGPGPGHVGRVLLREHVRRRQQVQTPSGPDHLHLEAVTHPRLLEIGPEDAVDQPHGGEVLDPREAELPQRAQIRLGEQERVGAVDAGQHRRPLHDGQDLAGHLQHDLVGVAVREQAGQGSAPRHPVAPRVVDHDEIDAAGVLALRGQAGAGPAADDRLAAADHLVEALEDLLAGHARHAGHRPFAARALGWASAISRKLVASASAKAWSFRLYGNRSSLRVGPARNPVAIVSNNARSAGGSQNGPPGASSSDTPPSGIRNRTGPSMRLSLSTRKRPMAAHSSGVVRINVTFGLCRWSRRPANALGTVSMAQKFTMSS